MRRLSARVAPVASVSAAERRVMFALLGRYYDEVELERFDADLSAKDDVILLEDDGGQIRGFSTLKNLEVEIDGARHYGLFSGDTVVDKEFWGQRVLGQAFLRYLFAKKARHPLRPYWWFLISKGYKTYLLMANNFADHYPNFERPTPTLEQNVLDGFGASLFGSAYDPSSGLIRFERSLGQLKSGVADITPELLANPKIAFFQARNPGWATGTELACVARMTWSMPFYYGVKALWKTRRLPSTVGSAIPVGEAR